MSESFHGVYPLNKMGDIRTKDSTLAHYISSLTRDELVIPQSTSTVQDRYSLLTSVRHDDDIHYLR